MGGLVVTASCRSSCVSSAERGAGLQGTERLSRGSNRVARAPRLLRQRVTAARRPARRRRPGTATPAAQRVPTADAYAAGAVRHRTAATGRRPAAGGRDRRRRPVGAPAAARRRLGARRRRGAASPPGVGGRCSVGRLVGGTAAGTVTTATVGSVACCRRRRAGGPGHAAAPPPDPPVPACRRRPGRGDRDAAFVPTVSVGCTASEPGPPRRPTSAVRCRVPVALGRQRLLDDDLLDVVAHVLRRSPAATADAVGLPARPAPVRRRPGSASPRSGSTGAASSGTAGRRGSSRSGRTPRQVGHRAGGQPPAPVAVRLVAPVPGPRLRRPPGSAARSRSPRSRPFDSASGLGRHDHTPAPAVRAGRREVLEQPAADPLAGHLHQAQRGHLGDLVAGAVAGQALGQPPQHQVAVGLEHHVDEVDDDDAADVAQPQLADDLLGRLEVVAGDGLLEVAARSRCTCRC